MRLTTLAATLTLVACAGTPARAPGPQAARAVITEELHASAQAWNRGDLDGFLVTYDDGPHTTFGGASGFVRGLDQVRQRYQQSYWSSGPPEDSLSFDVVEVRMLGDDAALVLGRYRLDPPDHGAPSTGFFSLVYRLTDDGWKIVHDHSSATP